VGCSERYTEHFEILFFDLECMSIIAKGILFFFWIDTRMLYGGFNNDLFRSYAVNLSYRT
jgi:hypothetical protein